MNRYVVSAVGSGEAVLDLADAPDVCARYG